MAPLFHQYTAQMSIFIHHQTGKVQCLEKKKKTWQANKFSIKNECWNNLVWMTKDQDETTIILTVEGQSINLMFPTTPHTHSTANVLNFKIFNATTVRSVLKRGLKIHTGWQFNHIKMIIEKKHPLAKKYKTRQRIQVWSESQYHHLMFPIQKPTAFATNKRQKSYLKLSLARNANKKCCKCSQKINFNCDWYYTASHLRVTTFGSGGTFAPLVAVYKLLN